ncbi:peptidase M50 [Halothece sp. PCC 7418]|uniref:site-2 protease family protein n=1 Tax=Halothece sp. (strain PCC 7418) TaxID=65093 RepID=UPI0002A05E39|nr:site-2 protease family protein [Halothece sp. PCC 7418]AFZ43765.1 peptidase M50 [Halothece sp. PCC 7418]
MDFFFILLLLAGITYLLVRRSASGLTTTPIWLLWFVVMIPAFTWSLWLLFMGEEAEIPVLLILIPFILSPLLYFWLLQRGRQDPTTANSSESVEKEPLKEKLNDISLEKEDNNSQSTRILSQSEEEKLKTCFPWEVYYLQNVDYGGQAVLCRGKLRTVPEKAYQKIQTNVQKQFGDRFLILFQESFQGEPFFALVPNPKKEKKETTQDQDLNKPWLALSLAVITLFTTTIIGANLAGVSSEEFQSNPSLLREGLPYALTLMWILGCHEFSHYCAAIYYKIKATLPYFIPVPFFLGTFGAFIQMRSPIPHRRALFDVAIAGPLGGFIMTVPLLFWGLSLSEIVPLSEESALLNINSLDPRSSLLMTVFCKIALGSQLGAESAIDLHPIAIAGYIGLIVTALNLMPVGQLDGGHIAHAIYGQRTAVIIGQVSRLLMLILALVEPSFLIWAIILFFMPIIDEPALNDVTELDDIRDLLGFLALTLLVTILLPLPATFTDLLNV